MPDPISSIAGGAILQKSPLAARRRIILLLRIVVSACLLGLVARHISWERVALRINDITIPLALLALVSLVGATLCVAFRWRVIASAVARPIRLVDAWRVDMIGGAFDQAIFTMSGDAYRILWLKMGAPSLTRAVAGVLLDHVAGVLGITLLVLLFLSRFAALDAPHGLIWVPMGIAASAVCGFAGLLLLDKMPFICSRNRWLAGLEVLSSSARMVFLSPALAIPATAAAVMVQICVSICITLLAWALGISLGLWAALTVIPTVMLISLLPISIGGWGVREGAMVVALGLVGIDSSDAILISVMYGLGAAALGLSGAMLWMVGLRASKPLADH